MNFRPIFMQDISTPRWPWTLKRRWWEVSCQQACGPSSVQEFPRILQVLKNWSWGSLMPCQVDSSHWRKRRETNNQEKFWCLENFMCNSCFSDQYCSFRRYLHAWVTPTSAAEEQTSPTLQSVPSVGWLVWGWETEGRNLHTWVILVLTEAWWYLFEG